MSTPNQEKVKMLLAKAKSGLILDEPFFASLLLPMPIVEDNSVPTMATDGDKIYYNTEYMASKQLPEVTFILAHETLHAAFEHCLTLGNKNHNKWNIATDYIINDFLVKDRIGVMPKGGLLNSQLVIDGNGTADGVYKLLPKDAEGKGAGQPGGAMDSLKPGAKDVAEQRTKSADMKVKVLQAKNIAKMYGKLSAGLEKLVEEITRSETNWRAYLRQFLTERAKIDFSFARPKRRFLADDIYLPSLIGEKMGRIVIAVDCSGSAFDGQTLSAFEGEINAIKEDVNPSEIVVMYFDAKVLKIEIFTNEDEFKIKPVGGGGTKYSPIFNEIQKMNDNPVACIVLTDLICDDFGKSPECPVLWASTKRGEAPFGSIIYVKDEEK